MKTKDDPTISRIREARHRISEKCGHDPRRLVEYYTKLQERHRDRLMDAKKSASKENVA